MYCPAVDVGDSGALGVVGDNEKVPALTVAAGGRLGGEIDMPTRTDARARAAYLPRLTSERTDIALCRASAVVARAADAAAAKSGLGVGHHLVLKMLAAVGPCSQQVLSAELRIDRSVMVGIADDLEESGYIRRERDPADRRAYAVTITEPGRQALTEAEGAIPDFLDHAFSALTRTERDQLTTLLGKLLFAD